ncbi:uncharacterized protein STEHIDRAFT_172674 [Stereum hirsutum FP-91666 SS1]|uniref:Uncharacterized protein n=1 Tax=Stereum hirsutum (strain FP-91666) TaxID=721885 RepID=R7RZT5_STEHR|nr:uncharacterized protein STEHIDRAFT_172674 [Stereum hirsutum FP-91666 SS1]EIM80415.1 hypothetical protein STEHIDRAFT_172674 [Stereum hirsutum FP-91666 SS1]
MHPYSGQDSSPDDYRSSNNTPHLCAGVSDEMFYVSSVRDSPSGSNAGSDHFGEDDVSSSPIIGFASSSPPLVPASSSPAFAADTSTPDLSHGSSSSPIQDHSPHNAAPYGHPIAASETVPSHYSKLEFLLQVVEEEQRSLSSQSASSESSSTSSSLDAHISTFIDDAGSTQAEHSLPRPVARISSYSTLAGALDNRTSASSRLNGSISALKRKRSTMETILESGERTIPATPARLSRDHTLQLSQRTDDSFSSPTRTGYDADDDSSCGTPIICSPVLKKPRLCRGSNTSRHRLHYAQEPAALRKAKSLRSDESFSMGENRKSHENRNSHTGISSPIYLPVIIPVPPPELIPEFPLCIEDAADRRIQALLSREKRMHGTFGPPKQHTNFVPAVFPRSPSAVDGDDTLTYDVTSESGSETLASETQSEASTAMSPTRDLVVLTPAPWHIEPFKTMTRSETGSQGTSLDFSPGENLRAAALEWIMTVIPPHDTHPPHVRKPDLYSRDLYDQLTNDSSTRFLAAYLFGKYFFILDASEVCAANKALSTSSQESDGYEQGGDEKLKRAQALKRADLEEGRRRIVWDFAVAAVALSVKMLRDVLPPLKPIYARDFLVMAPHEMCDDDLEASQRDLLDAFSYNIGFPTPQQYLDELYIALPTLRILLNCNSLWRLVLNETWRLLNAAICDPEVHRFRFSLLTVTALQEGIIRTVSYKLHSGDTWTEPDPMNCHCKIFCPECQGGDVLESESWKESGWSEDLRIDAYEEADEVLEDVRDLMGIGALSICAASVTFSVCDFL